MQLRSTPALHERPNPFSSGAALRTSNYSAYIDGDLARLLDFKPPGAPARIAHCAVRRFLVSAAYPCVGAKSVLNQGTYRFGYYEKLSLGAAVPGLARDLCAFVAERKGFAGSFSTFIAAFENEGLSEDAFESALWTTLQTLRRIDAPFFDYDPTVSADPADNNYAFSFCCTAFFIVGMHSRCQRYARRSPYPLLVFNPHDQFRELRARQAWDRFRDIVRRGELALQGSLNPNLSDFGSMSEARQYAGKEALGPWVCPVRR